jgi:hypothetical protein
MGSCEWHDCPDLSAAEHFAALNQFQVRPRTADLASQPLPDRARAHSGRLSLVGSSIATATVRCWGSAPECLALCCRRRLSPKPEDFGEGGKLPPVVLRSSAHVFSKDPLGCARCGTQVHKDIRIQSHAPSLQARVAGRTQMAAKWVCRSIVAELPGASDRRRRHRAPQWRSCHRDSASKLAPDREDGDPLKVPALPSS